MIQMIVAFLKYSLLNQQNMGVNQTKENSITPLGDNLNDITKSRFLKQSEATLLINHQQTLAIRPFKRLVGWELQLLEIPKTDPTSSTMLLSSAYFSDLKELDAYLSNMISLKQICQINIYDEMEVNYQKTPLSLTTLYNLHGMPKILNKVCLRSDIPKLINLLSFISGIIEKVQNLYIIPDDLCQVNGQFYLRGFQYLQCSRTKLLLAYIYWVFGQQQFFEQGEVSQNITSSFDDVDIFIKQIFLTLRNGKVNEKDLTLYFKKVNERMYYLGGNFDSYHACWKSKKLKNNVASNNREWLLAKKDNEVYFFNIADSHACQGRIIRKKKKINIENNYILFNPDQLEVWFMHQGGKNMLRTTQFELEDHFTISDVQIKFKFPLKIRNPMMFMKGKEIYMYDQMVYRYNIQQNKVYQDSKRINDCIMFVSSYDFNYMAIRLSIDIFKHGIRIYIADRYQTLIPSGNPQLSGEIESIKIDIKHVDICLEVYKGIFIMLANKNFWILDLNFMVFFSYAPIQRIKDHTKGKLNGLQQNDFIFQITNQSFQVSWLHNQYGINTQIKQDIFNVIGSIHGKLFYLKYRLIFEAGLLNLISCKPLFEMENVHRDHKIVAQPKLKEYYFNVYNQNLEFYKTGSWIHRGIIFLEVKNVKMANCKNFTQIFIQTQDTTCNLKQIIQQNKRIGKRWEKFQICIILYRILTIYNYLNRNNTPHKNVNLNNLWVTSSRMVKLSGWSEPQRNWHVSDYKDFLLVCFNIITQNNYQKFTDKLIQKHEAEMELFQCISDKIKLSLRNKIAEKKNQSQKLASQIKQSLNSEIYKFISTKKESNMIFNFQHNTPRFSMLDVQQGKIKKMIAVIQSNNNTEQFTFKSTDNCTWNQLQSCLYIFTATYQMFQIKIEVNDYKEETYTLDQYEYLPNNIVDFSFIHCLKGLFAIGGVARNSKKKVQYNKKIYFFNRTKLTWQSVAEIPSPRINPKLILSQMGGQIYIMGGQLNTGNGYLQAFVFDTSSNRVQEIIDLGIANPFMNIKQKNTYKIFNLSEKYNIFMLWTISPTTYTFKIFSSLVGGFQIDFQGKIYLEDADIPPISITFWDGAVHFLKSYGKYSKITIEGLELPKVNSKTLYSN